MALKGIGVIVGMSNWIHLYTRYMSMAAFGQTVHQYTLNFDGVGGQRNR